MEGKGKKNMKKKIAVLLLTSMLAMSACGTGTAGCVADGDFGSGVSPGTAETADAMAWLGEYSLENCLRMGTGLFVRYPDGTFDPYYEGSPITYDGDPTKIAGSQPKGLIVHGSNLVMNRYCLDNGQLVLFSPSENDLLLGLYAVEESGYTLSRSDENGNLEVLFFGGQDYPSRWIAGTTFDENDRMRCEFVNGIAWEVCDPVLSGQNRRFAAFERHDTLTIGVMEGESLVQREYAAEYRYCLCGEESTGYGLTPTESGYSLLDFSDTPAGEYVFSISYWDENCQIRRCWTYLIEVKPLQNGKA